MTGLQFTSIRRLLFSDGASIYRGSTCSSHPSAGCYKRWLHHLQKPHACSSHPSADCYYGGCWQNRLTTSLQFTSIRRLLLPGRRAILWHLACSSHPSADCYGNKPTFHIFHALAVHIHPQIVTVGFMIAVDAGKLAVHIHPQIVTAISCVQQVYQTLSIEQPGNMDMMIGSISEEIHQHSREPPFLFLSTVGSHIVAAPHDKIFFIVFVVFSFCVSRISGHSVCHCTHIPGHHPILLAYHLQLQTDFYAVEQVLLRNA